MKKLGQLLLLLMGMSLLAFNAPLEAKKCRKRKRCCRVVQGPQGIAGATGATGAAGAPGPAFENFVFSYKTDAQTSSDTVGDFSNITYNVDSSISNWIRPDTASFQATEAGIYLIDYATRLVPGSGDVDGASIRVTLNDIEIPGSQIGISTVINSDVWTKSIIVQLVAGNIIRVQFATNEGGSTVSIAPAGVGTPPTSASITITRIS